MATSDSTTEAAGEARNQLHQDFTSARLVPLWTQTPNDLMPATPTPEVHPHVWNWAMLLPLAERAGKLVPVGRGGERRAIGLAKPGLGGNPFVPTLWTVIEYLGSFWPRTQQ